MTTSEDDRRNLAIVATALSEEVSSLRAAEVAQGEQFRRLRVEVEKKNFRTTIKIRWMVTLLVVDLFLSGAMVFDYFKIADLLENREVVRTQVLCPLYNIFVSSYNPNSLAAKAQGIEQYNATFDEIRRQYRVLNCVPTPTR